MNYLTKKEFLNLIEELKKTNPEHWGNGEWKPGQPKATDRWSYHEQAIKLLKDIEPKSILEAGSMDIFLSDISDSIDLNMPEWGWRLTYAPTYNHDLTKIPWAGIGDKQYDVFVALRVFHHMTGAKRYFNEMARVANHLILAFPPETADRYEEIRKPDLKFYFGNTDTTVLYYQL